MEGGKQYVSKIGDGQTPCTWIPNALSKKTIEKFRLEAKKVCAKNERFVVGYTGTLGFTNSVITIIKAASLLRQDTNIKFVILGKGPQEEQLKQAVVENDLSNVEFLPHGTEDVVIATLQQIDASLICWHDRSLYKFGTSAIKIPTYLAVGKPIIQAYSGRYDRINLNKAGITVPAEDAHALADAIIKIKNKTDAERNKLGENGYLLAQDLYSYEVQMPKLLRALDLNF
jgi:glycosyltransferase involved in cell wall biosynthesis